MGQSLVQHGHAGAEGATSLLLRWQRNPYGKAIVLGPWWVNGAHDSSAFGWPSNVKCRGRYKVSLDRLQVAFTWIQQCLQAQPTRL